MRYYTFQLRILHFSASHFNMSPIQLLCNTLGAAPAIVTFPDELGPYSNIIKTIKDNTYDDGDVIGSDCEEEESNTSQQIPVTALPETAALVIELLRMNYKGDYSNTTPTPKKVTAPKFDIQKRTRRRNHGIFGGERQGCGLFYGKTRRLSWD